MGILSFEVFKYFWFTCFGAVVGSFLNVVIYRVPRGYLLSLPSRSMCPSCKTQLQWFENIPIFSYLASLGKCRHCAAAIPPRYLLVEIFCALLFLGVIRVFDFSFEALFYALFCASMLAVTFIDLDFRIIPDRISIGGMLIALAASHWIDDLGLINACLGAAIGAGFFWLLAAGYERFAGREGLGFGDVKLMGFIGAALGVRGVGLTIALGSVIGSVVGLIVMKAQSKDLKLAIPFGPFLALGALITLFWGDLIYSHFFWSNSVENSMEWVK